MSLLAPNLDDRRFQQLVDDAKRLVQQRCPEWTDHNVSDPGVTLIETVAFMVDQLLYRLNRVPERNYLKFLELIGVRLFPPAASRTDVTFWLSAPQAATVAVPAGTEVATLRTDSDEPVVFSVERNLDIVPCSLMRLASSIAESKVRDHTTAHESGRGFFCFDAAPKPGDALLIGLSSAVPSCAVLLRFDCEIEGIGVDPHNPPLVWEAWDGQTWVACELDIDETGGLNRAGDVVLHVPPTHQVSVINRQRAGWLRCRVVQLEEDQPAYSASPKISALAAATIGGTVGVLNAETIPDEIVGLSEGVPGQRFALKRRPLVAGLDPLILEVAGGDGWDEWLEVENFAQSDGTSRHFVVDREAGEIMLGPAVRAPDGGLVGHGAVPPKAAPLRLRSYRVGGGRRGNVAAGAITVLKTSIPYVNRISNRRRAQGGVDGETVEDAKVRGPILLRTRNRAVTAEDYEVIARRAAPEVARVHCVRADEPGAVRILVVPAAEDDEGGLRFDQLIPAEATLSAVAAAVDEARVVGVRIVVEPPVYQGVTVVARVRARARAAAEKVQRTAVGALNSYFHPISGGPDGVGWPLGRPLHVGEVYSVLQHVRGIELVEEVHLFAADPVTGARGQAAQRIDLPATALAFSYDHQVLVQPSDES